MKKSLNILSAATFAFLLGANGILPASAMQREGMYPEAPSSSAGLRGDVAAHDEVRYTLHVQGGEVPEESEAVNTLILSGPTELTGALVQEHPALVTVDTIDLRHPVDVSLGFLSETIFAEGLREVRVAVPCVTAGLNRPFEELGILPNLRTLRVNLALTERFNWPEHVLDILRQLQQPVNMGTLPAVGFEHVQSRFPLLEEVQFILSMPTVGGEGHLLCNDLTQFFASYPFLREVGYYYTSKKNEGRSWLPSYQRAGGDMGGGQPRSWALDEKFIGRPLTSGEIALELVGERSVVDFIRSHWNQQVPTKEGQEEVRTLVGTMLDVVWEHTGLLVRRQTRDLPFPTMPPRALVYPARVITAAEPVEAVAPGQVPEDAE